MSKLFLFVILLVLIVGCQKEDDDQSIRQSIEFTLSESGQVYKSTSVGFSPSITLPFLQDDESKITDYIRTNQFIFDNPSAKSISIQLHQTIDVIDGVPDLNNLFVSDAKTTDAKYLIELLDHRGFGVAVEFTGSDQVIWSSYNAPSRSLDINQEGSVFDTYDVIELDTAAYVQANFSCNLYNELGDMIQLEGGDLTFRLY